MSTLEPPVNSARSAEPPVEPPRLTAPSSSGKSALSRRLRRWERGTLELNNLWYECVTVYRRTKNACKGDLSDLFSTAGRLRRVRLAGRARTEVVVREKMDISAPSESVCAAMCAVFGFPDTPKVRCRAGCRILVDGAPEPHCAVRHQNPKGFASSTCEPRKSSSKTLFDTKSKSSKSRWSWGPSG